MFHSIFQHLLHLNNPLLQKWKWGITHVKSESEKKLTSEREEKKLLEQGMGWKKTPSQIDSTYFWQLATSWQNEKFVIFIVSQNKKQTNFCQPRLYHHFCHLHCLLYLFQTFFAVALPQRLDFALKQGIGDLDIYIYHFWDKENTVVDKKQVSHRHWGTAWVPTSILTLRHFYNLWLNLEFV